MQVEQNGGGGGVAHRRPPVQAQLVCGCPVSKHIQINVEGPELPVMCRHLLDFTKFSEIARMNDVFTLKTKQIILYIFQHIRNCDIRDFLHVIFNATHPNNELVRNYLLEARSDDELWAYAMAAMIEAPKRSPLHHIQSITDVAGLLGSCQRILVITGARASPVGQSTAEELRAKYPTLTDTKKLFTKAYLRADPRPFFEFVKKVIPQLGPNRTADHIGPYPTPVHHFIKYLADNKRLHRHYTQSVDMLELVAGVQPVQVIPCMGALGTATCTRCALRVYAIAIEPKIRMGIMPMCERCNPLIDRGNYDVRNNQIANLQPDGVFAAGILLPDVRFHDEAMPPIFYKHVDADIARADCVFVIGSDLDEPALALMLDGIDRRVPQILINKSKIKGRRFDVELLGDEAVALNQLAQSVSTMQLVRQINTMEPAQPADHMSILCHRRPAGHPSLTLDVRKPDSTVMYNDRPWAEFHHVDNIRLIMKHSDSFGLVEYMAPDIQRFHGIDRGWYCRLSHREYIFQGALVRKYMNARGDMRDEEEENLLSWDEAEVERLRPEFPDQLEDDESGDEDSTDDEQEQHDAPQPEDDEYVIGDINDDEEQHDAPAAHANIGRPIGQHEDGDNGELEQPEDDEFVIGDINDDEERHDAPNDQQAQAARANIGRPIGQHGDGGNGELGQSEDDESVDEGSNDGEYVIEDCSDEDASSSPLSANNQHAVRPTNLCPFSRPRIDERRQDVEYLDQQEALYFQRARAELANIVRPIVEQRMHQDQQVDLNNQRAQAEYDNIGRYPYHNGQQQHEALNHQRAQAAHENICQPHMDQMQREVLHFQRTQANNVQHGVAEGQHGAGGYQRAHANIGRPIVEQRMGQDHLDALNNHRAQAEYDNIGRHPYHIGQEQRDQRDQATLASIVQHYINTERHDANARAQHRGASFNNRQRSTVETSPYWRGQQPLLRDPSLGPSHPINDAVLAAAAGAAVASGYPTLAQPPQVPFLLNMFPGFPFAGFPNPFLAYP